MISSIINFFKKNKQIEYEPRCSCKVSDRCQSEYINFTNRMLKYLSYDIYDIRNLLTDKEYDKYFINLSIATASILGIVKYDLEYAHCNITYELHSGNTLVINNGMDIIQFGIINLHKKKDKINTINSEQALIHRDESTSNIISDILSNITNTDMSSIASIITNYCQGGHTVQLMYNETIIFYKQNINFPFKLPDDIINLSDIPYGRLTCHIENSNCDSCTKYSLSVKYLISQRTFLHKYNMPNYGNVYAGIMCGHLIDGHYSLCREFKS